MAKPETAPVSDGPAFETSDVTLRTYAVLLGILLGVMLLTIVAVVGFRLLSGPVPAPPAFGRAATTAPPPAEAPRLQAEPQAELGRYLAAQRARLYRYGWVDRDRRLVHIPIEEAMKLLVERGWPDDRPPREAPP